MEAQKTIYAGEGGYNYGKVRTEVSDILLTSDRRIVIGLACRASLTGTGRHNLPRVPFSHVICRRPLLIFASQYFVFLLASKHNSSSTV